MFLNLNNSSLGRPYRFRRRISLKRGALRHTAHSGELKVALLENKWPKSIQLQCDSACVDSLERADFSLFFFGGGGGGCDSLPLPTFHESWKGGDHYSILNCALVDCPRGRVGWAQARAFSRIFRLLNSRRVLFFAAENLARDHGVEGLGVGC